MPFISELTSPPPRAWWESPAGQYILRWELEQCDKMVTDIFGYVAMQVNGTSADYLRSNRMPTRVRCAHCAWQFDKEAGLYSHPEQLALASDSMDLLILPHVLEYAASPHAILREVGRVLIPEGQALFIGFNPNSFYGAFNRWSRSAKYWHPGRYIRLSRLKDWCEVLGLEVQRGVMGRYLPPFANERWFARLHFAEYMGHRWWPFAGSVYMLLVAKKVPAMRLIKAKKRSASRVADLAAVGH